MTTNASLGELAAALSHYANREVMALGEPAEAFAGRVGAFDSALHATRHGAARAIKQLLNNADWHVLRLTDGKLLLISGADRKLLLADKPMTPLRPLPTGNAVSSSTDSARRPAVHGDYE